MKNILLPLCGIIVLTLCSFLKNPQPEPLKKISKNLYELKTTASLSSAGQAKLKVIIAREYGIRSFSDAVVVHYSPEKDLKGNGVAMAEQRLSAAAFQQTILEDGDEEVKQSCIFTNCSSNPAISDILQVLTTYNAH